MREVHKKRNIGGTKSTSSAAQERVVFYSPSSVHTPINFGNTANTRYENEYIWLPLKHGPFAMGGDDQVEGGVGRIETFYCFFFHHAYISHGSRLTCGSFHNIHLTEEGDIYI